MVLEQICYANEDLSKRGVKCTIKRISNLEVLRFKRNSSLFKCVFAIDNAGIEFSNVKTLSHLVKLGVNIAHGDFNISLFTTFFSETIY